MSMSTAPSPRAFGPALVDRSTCHVATLSAGSTPVPAPDLTIHRITRTHHGRTLLLLGHAAEYLANSRRFMAGETVKGAEEEAVHILMSLSRSVFEEYAEGNSGKRRLDQLVFGCVTRLLN
jgi:hypothetical protein